MHLITYELRDEHNEKSRVLLSALVAVASVSILGVSTANASIKVNDYIGSQGIKPVGVTKSIWVVFLRTLIVETGNLKALSFMKLLMQVPQSTTKLRI